MLKCYFYKHGHLILFCDEKKISLLPIKNFFTDTPKTYNKTIEKDVIVDVCLSPEKKLVFCANKNSKSILYYTLENVDAYDTKNETLQNLIKLNYEITTLELTREENEVKQVIDEIMELNNRGKKRKSIFGFLDYNTMLKIICGFIPFLIFFGFQSRRMFKEPEKKELDEGTKELLEAIKQRGRKSPNYKEPTEEKDKENNEKNKYYK